MRSSGACAHAATAYATEQIAATMLVPSRCGRRIDISIRGHQDYDSFDLSQRPNDLVPEIAVAIDVRSGPIQHLPLARREHVRAVPVHRTDDPCDLLAVEIPAGAVVQ